MNHSEQDDLLGESFENLVSPTSESASAESEFDRLKRHAQQSVDFVGEHCQSSRMVTSDGTPIIVGEPNGAAPSNLDEGPQSDGTFRYGGDSFPVPRIPWRLLDFMWGRDCAPIDEVEDSVWPDGATPSALKSALNKLNETLSKACYPKYLGQKQGKLGWN